MTTPSAADNAHPVRPATSNRIAVQMYTLRSLATPLPELLAQIAAAGYTGIETFGPLAPEAPAFRELLDAAGLQVVSAHVGIDVLRNELPAVVAWHQTLGNRILVAPWLAPDQRPADAAGWRALGADLATIGLQARDAGMQLLYHNHDFEMVTYDGRTAFEWLFAGADATAPGALGAELDLAWVVRGNQDPAALLAALAGRVPRAHAKDVAAPGADPAEIGMADVGAGIINWDELLPAVRAAGVDWLVVEHDAPTDPLRSIQRSAAYLSGRW